jgi:hypothetical protein
MSIVALTIGIVGSAEAISFSSTKYIGQRLSGDGVYRWKQDGPTDLRADSQIIKATLGISGWLVRGDGIKRFVDGSAIRNLKKFKNLSFRGFGFDWSKCGIKNIIAGWTGGPFSVFLNYMGMKGFKSIYSKFNVEYTNGSTPISEPATLLLLGVGLIGISIFGRNKFHSKSPSS